MSSSYSLADIDSEWMELIKEAKKIGLTKDEILSFLKSKDLQDENEVL